MRRKKSDLPARVNGHLALRFTAEGLTSYSGLELLRRFLVGIGFASRLRRHLQGTDSGADFAASAMVHLVVALLVVGGRRLRHVGHLAGDPVVERFCSLRTLPTDRTLSRWLARCRAPVRAALLALMMELIGECIRTLRLRRLTMDVDGTVLSTGLQVERARRGYNPHRRKVPSYYPITAHLAQTGHILAVRNRAGNVHDGKASVGFLRDLFTDLREQAPDAVFEIRLDGAFFRREILGWLDARAEYAIKVPFYQWVDLQGRIRARRRWRPVAPGVQGFAVRHWLDPWQREVRIAIFRKKVWHRSPKNYQLDLFSPDDGHWEYAAVATNKTVTLRTLWHFMGGRGAHEKVIGELKSGYAFDSIPSQDYAANSTWQILSVLAYNLVTGFQLETDAAERPKSLKRTAHFVLRRIQSLRFELFARAGIVQYPQGRPTLTLAHNLPTRHLFEQILASLQKAA